MENYIAYFDILGFKEFILNKEVEYYTEYFNNIIIHSQTAISGEKYRDGNVGEYVPDLRDAEVKCLHVSDSIIFWTEGELNELNFLKIVQVCYTFFWRCMQTHFLVRGCLVVGDIQFEPFELKGKSEKTFYNSSLFGKGLTQAYLKAEDQDWAGAFIDDSAIKTVNEKVIADLIYDNKIVYYPIPRKDGSVTYEHVFKNYINLNNVAFRNAAKTIEELFHRHMNGKPLNESVKRKMNNTIKFLSSLIVET